MSIFIFTLICALQGPPFIQHEKEGGHIESLVEKNLGGQFHLFHLICSDAHGNGPWIGSNMYLLAPLRLRKEEAMGKYSLYLLTFSQ